MIDRSGGPAAFLRRIAPLACVCLTGALSLPGCGADDEPMPWDRVKHAWLRVVESRCGYHVRCCPEAGDYQQRFDACVTAIRNAEETALSLAVYRGAELDPEAAEQCASLFITPSCQLAPVKVPCYRMFYNPRGWPGITACEHNADCARPVEGYGYCDLETTKPPVGTCSVYEIGLWKPCDYRALCESDPSRFCDSWNNLCRPRLGLGEPCRNGPHEPCAIGLTCGDVSETCEPAPDPATLGPSCVPSCGIGEFCADENVCAPKKALGEPCGALGKSPRYECLVDDVNCQDGICRDCSALHI